jgi:HSP20 family molecular chaperone IbpA
MTERKELQVQTAEPRTVDATRDRPVVRPETDIYETKDAIIIVMDVPGVEPASVDVQLEEDVVTVRARMASVESPVGELLFREYCERDYERSFRLPVRVDDRKVEANLKNGVLTITLPLAPEVKPKQIQVKAD